MINAPLRILVAENQYLIAMEVERILLEAVECVVTIATIPQLADVLATATFDVVVIDAALTESLNVEHSRLIVNAGASPLFLSSYDHFSGIGPLVSAYPVVAKPPQADELAAAVMKAAHGQGPSDSEGFLDDR